MKRTTTVITTLGLVLSLYGFADAHGDAHKTLMGTIDAVTDTEITVSTTHGKHVPVALRSSTHYVTTGGEAGARGDLHDGMRVVIKLDDHGHAADEVRYRPEERSTSGGEAGND